MTIVNLGLATVFSDHASSKKNMIYFSNYILIHESFFLVDTGHIRYILMENVACVMGE